MKHSKAAVRNSGSCCRFDMLSMRITSNTNRNPLRKSCQDLDAKYFACDNRPMVTRQRLHQIEHAERQNARQAVGRAVVSGRLKVPSECDNCQITVLPLQAHHHRGYDKDHQLDVRWLCSGCHGISHRKPRNTKDCVAQAMAHKRWAKTTAAQRVAHARKMVQARQAKRGAE